MPVELHHDFETFSSVDIKECGSYKYFESPDFEILMVSYTVKTNGIYSKLKQFVPAEGDAWPQEYIDLLLDPSVEKHAHNANFERNALKAYGYDIPASEWRCSAVKAGYCGLPMSLDGATKALYMGDDGKSAEGKALIRYFSCLVKPTKANGGRRRNMWYHDPEKWEAYKRYNRRDVGAETKMLKHLEPFRLPAREHQLYALDQKINDRGVNVDVEFAMNAIAIDNRFNEELTAKLKNLTGLVNPNSTAQLTRWLSSATNREIKTIAKDAVQDLIKELKSGAAVEVLKLRVMASKTSTKKYETLVKCALLDFTAHGLLYFYGANRTGRWAGRLLQIHNLPRNKMKLLEFARNAVKAGDYELLEMMFDDLPKVLSELIRTAIVASEGNTLAVADYSAIEGRITAWLAGEKWRLDVFAGDGKIYEASASMMFNIPIESIGKGSEYRDKGKIAELALGFGGSVGALKTMGGEAMGLSETEMQNIVDRWRKASPKIVSMWYEFEDCAIKALKIRKPVVSKLKGIVFNYEHKCLTIKLPSGRKLIYREACLTKNRWNGDAIKYKGKHQKTGQWAWVETYGGKLSENIIQAIARDLLAEGMLRIDKAGFDIVMHVHDEVVCDIPDLSTDFVLSELCRILGEPVDWAPGLGTPAEGFVTPYYKKD
jgi:DNA polymerase